MPRAIPVIPSLFLSLLLATGPQPSLPQDRTASGPAEPGGPLGAVASLLSVRETPRGRVAVLRIDLVAHGADAEATVTPLAEDRSTPRGPALGSVLLRSEQRRSMIVEAVAPAERETHLFYRVTARGDDGATTELNVYFRVPPDDPDSCQVVGDYIQCPGETLPEVQP